MNIALVSSSALPTPPADYGGLERVVYDLADELVALGHQVDLHAIRGSRAPQGARLVTFGETGPGTFTVDAAAMLEADIVHFHDWGFLAWQMANARPDRRFVYTWHGPTIGPLCGWQSPPPNVLMCGVSHYHAAVIAAETGSFTVGVPNGIPIREYPLWTGERDGYLLYVNRIAPEKGLHLAMDFARQANMRLLVAGPEHLGGDPVYTQRMMGLMDGDRVRYLGSLALPAKVQAMQHAAAVLWTAPGFVEPFGLGAVEAMATGTPVVAMATGALTETITEGGVLFDHPADFRDALAEALTITPEEARANAERFSAAVMARAYQDLYASVLRPPGAYGLPF